MEYGVPGSSGRPRPDTAVMLLYLYIGQLMKYFKNSCLSASCPDRSGPYRRLRPCVAQLSVRALLAIALLGLGCPSRGFCAPSAQDISPGQVQRQIERMPSPQGAPKAVPLPEAAKTQVTLEAQSFVLSGVLIEGASAFKNIDLLPFYKAYLGKKITVSDLRKIADAITQHYHKGGYFLSSAFLPAQRIEFGIVRLRIIEGYVASWKITGGADSNDPILQKILNPITDQHPLRRVVLDNAFQKLSSLPDIVFHPYVRPIKDQLGAYELVLETGEKHFGASLSVDNHGSEYLGPFQGVVSLRGFDLTGHHDTYQFTTASTADTGVLQYYDISSDWLLGINGARLQATVAYTAANPGGSLKSLDAHIENNRFRLGALYPLRRSVTRSTYLNLAIDVYRSHTDLYNVTRIKERLASVELSIRHAFSLDSSATHSMGITLTKGLHIGDAESMDTQTGTEIGRPDFFKFNLYYTYLKVIAGRIELSTQVDGQYATSTLPGLELYSIGGQKFGAAYDPSEITGDSGAAGRMEFTYLRAVTAADWGMSPYVFYDLGKVWQSGSQAAVDSASLASGGLGVRASNDVFSSYLEVDKPLTRPVASQGNDGKDLRVFGGIAYQF